MKLKHVLFTIAFLILILIAGGIWQFFKGNPLGVMNAEKETEQYVNNHYDDHDWSIVQTVYDFKNAAYVVRVQDENNETYHLTWKGFFGKTLSEDEILESRIDDSLLSERLNEEASEALTQLFRSTRPEVLSVDVSFEVLQGTDPDITWSPSLQPVRPFTFTVFVNGTKYDSTDLVRELAQHLQAVANKQLLDYSTGIIRVIEPSTEKEMYVSKFSPNIDQPIHVRQSEQKITK